MQLPSVFWIVVLVGGPALAAWLQQYFGGSDWSGPVAGLLVIGVTIAKAVQEHSVDTSTPVTVTTLPPGDAAQAPGETAELKSEQRGWVARTLW